MNARSVGVLVLVLVAGAAGCLACGPFFRPIFLVQSKALLAAPIGVFPGDIANVVGEQAPPPGIVRKGFGAAMVEGADDVLERDVADLVEATGGDAEAAAVVAYREFRATLLEQTMPYQVETSLGRSVLPTADEGLAAAVVPDGLPAEFREYAAGALAYRRGDAAAAAEHWERLLALPEDERRYRSVWAAWMLAKLSATPDEAVAGYQQVIDLVSAGNRDALGLAPAALGWVARRALDRGQRADAIELYYHQAMAGDAGAIGSLRQTIPYPGDDEVTPDEWERLAARPLARQLVTARVLAAVSPDTEFYYDLAPAEYVRTWVETVEAAGIASTEEAEQLAWAAYGNGDWEVARRWLAQVESRGALGHWLAGKLALRQGAVAEAAASFASALEGFPRPMEDARMPEPFDPSWTYVPADLNTFRTGQIWADFGEVKIAQSDFAAALDAFLRSGFREDAAYVAERLLSAEDLLAFVRERLPVGAGAVVHRGYGDAFDLAGADDGDVRSFVHYLLARRLGRERFFKDARDYYPPALTQVFDHYVEQFRIGADTTRPAPERAEALWQAAQVHRTLGMELFGAEGAPDYACYGGSFVGDDIAEIRARGVNAWGREFAPGLPVTDRELTLTAESEVDPSFRFHYRHVAAQLAWDACRLMPDGTDELARRLCTAGSWIRLRTPEQADRFYQALVRRAPATDLAKQAVEKKWFPDVDWSYQHHRESLVERYGNEVAER